MYQEEKNKLRETLQKNIGRVSLTTDGWTSGKKKSYMALTAHFIDNEWNLVKKVLNFRKLDGHRGINIGKKVESCLNEWGFDNVLSISVDNASANDSAIDFMKMILEKNYNCLLKGEWMHIRSTTTRHDLLRKQLDCEIHDEPPVDKHLYDIAKAMQPKFDKCYCEVENMNLLVYFAFVLDPRNKYDFLDVIMEDHYKREGLSVVTKKISYIKDELKLFFEDYVCIHAPSSTTSSTLGKRQRTTDTSDEPGHGDMLRRRMKRGQSSNSSISDLDKYVGEVCEPFDKSVHFDILEWWKVNSQRFPILSLMARDLLAIPISTVASESVSVTPPNWVAAE
ncbi:zinc finger BED domain-containing protein RICESLEEPER 2-like protein [Tanacetum coccineum]